MRVIRYNAGKVKNKRNYVQVGTAAAHRVYVNSELPFECVGTRLTSKGVVSIVLCQTVSHLGLQRADISEAAWLHTLSALWYIHGWGLGFCRVRS